MNPPEDQGRRRINIQLPSHLIERIDGLKKELGLRARGDLIEQLLENLFGEGTSDQPSNTPVDGLISSKIPGDDQIKSSEAAPKPPPSDYDETSALVLIGRSPLKRLNQTEDVDHTGDDLVEKGYASERRPSVGIDLPGFVRKRTEQLRDSLGQQPKTPKAREMPMVPEVSPLDLLSGMETASQHWLTLYGHPPGETVLEASMIWLNRDIWPNVDGVDGRPFTWTAANRLMQELCPSWQAKPSSFDRVMVVAGVLEDPFATKTLAARMPTLIRRFVNRFKRSRNVTSFQTLESTMTVQGALKLLGLSTQAGAALTLASIREAYKNLAMDSHPDAGGSTESMRRLNEAYLLLKELYRQK